jgi:hypothetical protein
MATAPPSLGWAWLGLVGLVTSSKEGGRGVATAPLSSVKRGLQKGGRWSPPLTQKGGR